MIRRVLVAADDSAGSVAAGRWAIGLAAGWGAALRVVTVVGDAVVREALATATPVADVRAARERSAGSVLGHLADAARRAGVAVDTVLLEGEPARKILDQAAAWPADMVVVGRSGRPSSAGAPYVGSHTRHVLEFADVPVVVVPPSAAPDPVGGRRR